MIYCGGCRDNRSFCEKQAGMCGTTKTADRKNYCCDKKVCNECNYRKTECELSHGCDTPVTNVGCGCGNVEKCFGCDLKPNSGKTEICGVCGGSDPCGNCSGCCNATMPGKTCINFGHLTSDSGHRIAPGATIAREFYSSTLSAREGRGSPRPKSIEGNKSEVYRCFNLVKY